MLIGVTGTLGCGKSTIAAMFGRLGAAVLDADYYARQVVLPGSEALEEIKGQFGPEFILDNGALDRKKMGRHIFGSSSERHKLNRIIHPRVQEMMSRETQDLQAQEDAPPCVVWDVPLLFEAGMDKTPDRNVVVTVDEAQRFKRLRERDGLSESEIVQRLSSQWPQREKIQLADAVVNNSGSLDAAFAQVQEIWRQWLS
ncbi:MAG: dephospho-CoA kinase [Candidatus Sumerlaeia bacterium]